MTTTTDLPALLAKTPLMAAIPEEHRQALIDTFSTRLFTENQVLFERGAPAKSLGIVLQGTVGVYVEHDIHRYPVTTLGSGELVGEMSFFAGGGQRTARVKATRAGAMALLARSTYLGWLERGNPLAGALEQAVLWTLGDRLRATNETIAELLAMKDTRGMLAAMDDALGLAEDDTW